MNRFITSATALAVVLACAPAAHAALIDFESLADSALAPNMPALGHGDEFQQDGFRLSALSNQPGARSGDLVGAVVDGSDLANTCFGIVCPSNNPTTFYTALNDGVLAIERVDRAAFRLASFDASFIAVDLDYYTPTTTLLLALEGTTTRGDTVTTVVPLPGPLYGVYSFIDRALPEEYASTDFTRISLYGQACDVNGNCLAFSSNLGQFAIDNLDVGVTAVPEPAGWALMAAGLLGVASAVRRRTAD